MNRRTMRTDISDPYDLSHLWPEYTELRKNAPVHPITSINGQRLWLVSGHDAVRLVETDPRFSMNLANAVPELADSFHGSIPRWARPLAETLITSDPPQHGRLRRLVQPAFSPRILNATRGSIEQIVDGLLDRARAAGSLEFVDEFAFPMTIAVVSRFLGFPYEDRDRVRQWTQVLVQNFAGQDVKAIEQAACEFIDYLIDLFPRKRAHPGDDVISALIHARDQEEVLTEDELLAMVFNIVGGGFETTIALLTHGTKALLDHPEQLELLRRRPDLTGSAVEELLRFSAGGVGPIRYPREDVVIAGVTIPRGAPVMPLFSSANFDPRRFDEPHRLDITRRSNQHFSFGHGAHYCLGAPLARIEAEVAFPSLVRALPGLRPSSTITPSLVWQENTPFVRRITHMHLAFDTDTALSPEVTSS
uniref:Putative P450 n=1 Tax=Streptomyces argenteolus TaxID=67274 RepID=A9ZNV1_9ACTN|nr:putative P450 [Streptomyces argenteolus]